MQLVWYELLDVSALGSRSPVFFSVRSLARTVGFRSGMLIRLAKGFNSSSSVLLWAQQDGTQFIDVFLVITLDVPALGNLMVWTSTPVSGPSDVYFSSPDTIDGAAKV